MRLRRREDHIKRRLLKGEQPLSRLFPNMVTLAGLCIGLSSVRFAMLERWDLAVGAIIAAAIIDGMDGRIARLLGATSTFGAQLDSLSDFVCFGIAPALVLYLWALHDIRGIGWAVVLFFAVCTALRLARFNTGLFDDSKKEWEKQFFVGVPSPAGAVIALLPLYLSLQFDGWVLPATLVAIHLAFVGALMASRIPTFAGKHLRIRHEFILPLMIGCGALLVYFIAEPWLCLITLSLAYLVSIAVSVRRWRRLKTSLSS